MTQLLQGKGTTMAVAANSRCICVQNTTSAELCQ